MTHVSSPMRTHLPAAVALALFAVRPVPASAAGLVGVRMASASKTSVTLAVDLDGPGAVLARYGEAPLAWSGSAESPDSGAHHVLTLDGLVPDTQYFYQVEVDGAPAGDVLTFRSGRSWAARDATILVTADLPDGGPGETSLAERLFAEQADALVILGAENVSPDALRSLHGRAMTERLVVAAGLTPAGHAQVSDVAILLAASPGGDDLTREACWIVGGKASDVALASHAGPGATAVTTGGTLAIDLDDVRPGATAPAHYAKLRFSNGTLTATLHDATGAETARASLTKTCKAPESKQQLQQAFVDPEDPTAAGSSDIEADTKDCDG